MEILDTLLHRRSIRSFSGGSIPRETIEALLVAGMSGPAGKGKKPWRFVVVEDTETISLLAQARDPKQKLFDTASLVIAVFGDPSIADTWVEDCSVAMANMHLAADALGLAITHAHASPSMNKLAAQGALNRKTHGMYRAGRSH